MEFVQVYEIYFSIDEKNSTCTKLALSVFYTKYTDLPIYKIPTNKRCSVKAKSLLKFHATEHLQFIHFSVAKRLGFQYANLIFPYLSN